MRLINVPMRFVLGLPFATPLSSRLMLVFLTGRRTGKRYRQPVSYVRHMGTLLTPGGGRWKLNLEEGRPVRIRLRGHDVLATPELVTDVDETSRLLEAMTKANPGTRLFVGVPTGSDGLPERASLEKALRYGFRIVRWHLSGEETRSRTRLGLRYVVQQGSGARAGRLPGTRPLRTGPGGEPALAQRLPQPSFSARRVPRDRGSGRP
jgi:hypothetical protein